MKLKPCGYKKKFEKGLPRGFASCNLVQSHFKGLVTEWLRWFWFPIYHPFWPLSGSWFGTFCPHIRNIDMFQRGWTPQQVVFLNIFCWWPVGLWSHQVHGDVPTPMIHPAAVRGLLPRLGGRRARESPRDSAGGARRAFPGVGLQPMAISEISIDNSSILFSWPVFHHFWCG